MYLRKRVGRANTIGKLFIVDGEYHGGLCSLEPAETGDSSVARKDIAIFVMGELNMEAMQAVVDYLKKAVRALIRGCGLRKTKMDKDKGEGMKGAPSVTGANSGLAFSDKRKRDELVESCRRRSWRVSGAKAELAGRHVKCT